VSSVRKDYRALPKLRLGMASRAYNGCVEVHDSTSPHFCMYVLALQI
jgi:hypothetical protein